MFKFIISMCSLVFVFLCWPGMVPNQRQLSLIIFRQPFPPVACGILFFCIVAFEPYKAVRSFVCFSLLFVAGSHLNKL